VQLDGATTNSDERLLVVGATNRLVDLIWEITLCVYPTVSRSSQFAIVRFQS